MNASRPVGASSACFYPLVTEEAFKRVASLGFKTSEIFFNTPCELTGDCMASLLQTQREHGINVKAIHPFMSFAEGYCLFSSYKRRYEDYLEQMKRTFEAAEKLGAHIFVLHGAMLQLEVDLDEYCDRYYGLYKSGLDYGVTVAHENIVRYHSGSPEFLGGMKERLGRAFNMVLDIKQARRAGFSPQDFLDGLASSVIHIHLSDCSKEQDCLSPGEGSFDFASFFKTMTDLGYDGDYIIELYSFSFDSDRQLYNSGEYLNRLLNEARAEHQKKEEK